MAQIELQATLVELQANLDALGHCECGHKFQSTAERDYGHSRCTAPPVAAARTSKGDMWGWATRYDRLNGAPEGPWDV